MILMVLKSRNYYSSNMKARGIPNHPFKRFFFPISGRNAGPKTPSGFQVWKTWENRQPRQELLSYQLGKKEKQKKVQKTKLGKPQFNKKQKNTVFKL